MRRYEEHRSSASLNFTDWLNVINDGDSEVEEEEDTDESDYVSTSADEPVEISRVNFRAEANAKDHRTEKYDLVTDKSIPVLRRATSFVMEFETRTRPLDPRKDRITFVFEFGDRPSVTKGTKFVQDLDLYKHSLSEHSPGKWDIYRQDTDKNKSTLKVQIGSEAPVGVWKCTIQSSNRERGRVYKRTFKSKTPIYILFNPYSKDDGVYLASDYKLEEYIQNDVGAIWKGEYKSMESRKWIFGQFDQIVLPAVCFTLAQRTNLPDDERGNPILVSRTISAMVNIQDEDGIVKGRWAKPYDDGVAPWDWSGSIKILQEFVERCQPVRYGQCWVFSAVVVTVCRALGLPCRSVTNYVSAHDTNRSLTIDKYFNADGEELKASDRPGIRSDSIWNFHVWNDVWMTRPDLPAGYGGWQVIDSTPQETSDNAFQCGPCPVEAVRRGDIGLNYDVPFVFSEVNADVFHFTESVDSDWGFVRTKVKTDHVGKKIITNSVDDPDDPNDDKLYFKDITRLYKCREGSDEERLAVFNAVRGNNRAMRYYEHSMTGNEDVVFELLDMEPVAYGDSFRARISLENTSNETRTLKSVISSTSVYYTGVSAGVIKKAVGDFVLQPGQKEVLTLIVHPDEYMNKVVDYCNAKIYGQIQVVETKQMWTDEADFKLTKPKLKIEEYGHLRKDTPSQIRISFQNNLSVPLTNCQLTIECSGAVREIREKLSNVAPKDHFQFITKVFPKKAGRGTVVATFSSEEMIDVYGSKKVVIYE